MARFPSQHTLLWEGWANVKKRKGGFSVLCFALNPFTPGVSYGDIKVILTSESVDEILWCDHSNETSSAVLSHGSIYVEVFLQKEI